MLGSDASWPLWDNEEGSFRLQDPDAAPEVSVASTVARPVLLEYAPVRLNGRAMLVLSGGGYTQLMVGREGVQVARWLTGLGYHAFVLVHRFPNAEHGVGAALDDAMEAMRMIRAAGHRQVGVVGLSSGGHLAACLAASYPAEWSAPESRHGGHSTRPDVMIIGYAPISTNAKGRTISAEKPALPPPEKQAMYDRLQPDAQLLPDPPPTFSVYSGNDAVVPVENGRRLHAALNDSRGVAELHVFGDAPHGFALDTKDMPVSIWPVLCEAWLRQVCFL